MLDLNYIEVQAPCPKCNYILYVQLIDVKSEKIIFCHNCKSKIQLRDSNASSHKGIKDVNHAFDKLKKSLKKLGK